MTAAWRRSRGIELIKNPHGTLQCKHDEILSSRNESAPTFLDAMAQWLIKWCSNPNSFIVFLPRAKKWKHSPLNLQVSLGTSRVVYNISYSYTSMGRSPWCGHLEPSDGHDACQMVGHWCIFLGKHTQLLDRLPAPRLTQREFGCNLVRYIGCLQAVEMCNKDVIIEFEHDQRC